MSYPGQHKLINHSSHNASSMTNTLITSHRVVSTNSILHSIINKTYSKHQPQNIFVFTNHTIHSQDIFRQLQTAQHGPQITPTRHHPPITSHYKAGHIQITLYMTQATNQKHRVQSNYLKSLGIIHTTHSHGTTI